MKSQLRVFWFATCVRQNRVNKCHGLLTYNLDLNLNESAKTNSFGQSYRRYCSFCGVEGEMAVLMGGYRLIIVGKCCFFVGNMHIDAYVLFHLRPSIHPSIHPQPFCENQNVLWTPTGIMQL